MAYKAYNKDPFLISSSLSDPLDINPVEYVTHKRTLRALFMSYVPLHVDTIENMLTLERIFNQLVSLNPEFEKADVEEVVNRIIRQ